MQHKRRRSDIVGKEFQPYGELHDKAPRPAVPFKDRGTDELVWRQHGTGMDRRKGSNGQTSVPQKPKPTIEKMKKNAAGTRVGYNPYESGELVKLKNPGVRRNLRELGQLLKGKPRKKGKPGRK